MARIPSKMITQEKEKARLTESSSILLQNSTIEHLKQLHEDMSARNREYVITYDLLVIELIKSYRKHNKRLGDIWGSE